MSKIKVIIMGAAGRDFHNFNTVFRNNDAYEVVAFTATQIPNIDGRRYPPELAGKLYPAGIPIYPESDLTRLIKEHDVDQVVFAYSDVQHEYVMHKASQVLAAGADFRLIGPKETQIKSTQARRLDLRGAHRRGQEPDHAARVGNPEIAGLQGRRRFVIPCPTAIW